MNENVLAALEKAAVILGHIVDTVPSAAPMRRFVDMYKADLAKARGLPDGKDAAPTPADASKPSEDRTKLPELVDKPADLAAADTSDDSKSSKKK